MVAMAVLWHSGWTSCATAQSPDSPITLRLGWVGSVNSPLLSDLLAAFLAAVAAINDDPSQLLGNGSFRVVPYLSDPFGPNDDHSVVVQREVARLTSSPDCNVGSGAESGTPNGESGEGGLDVHAMVYLGGTASLTRVAPMAEANGKPLIATMARGILLSDKAKWPVVSRVIPDDRHQSKALARVVRDLGWRRVGILYVSSVYGLGVKMAFEDECRTLGVEVVARCVMEPGVDITSWRGNRTVSNVARSMARLFNRRNVRVYLVAADESDAIAIGAIIQMSQMHGPGYVPITPAELTLPVTGLISEHPRFDLIFAFIRKLLHGSIGLQAEYNPNSVAANRMWAAWPKNTTAWADLLAMAPQSANISAAAEPTNVRNKISVWSYYVFDATMLAARAVADAWAPCGGTLAGKLETGCLLDVLRSTAFNGTTGRVMLNANGDRVGGFSVTNGVGDATHEVGKVHTKEVANMTTTNIDTASIVWSDNSTNTSTGPSWGQVTNAPTAVPVAVGPPVAASATSETSDDQMTAMYTSVGLAVMLCLVTAYALRRRAEARNRKRQTADFSEVIARLARYEKLGVFAMPPVPHDDNSISDSGEVRTPDCARSVVREVSAPPELRRKDVFLANVIGHGQFGSVARGTWTTNAGRSRVPVPIAVKMIDSSTSTQVPPGANIAFLEEAVVTWQFEHDNVIKMYGVVTAGYPYLLVLELCENGSLIEYVQAATRPTDQLIRILIDIATGMAYLTSKHFVHRDLAARNVLLGTEFQAKVSDFGLGRCVEGDDYYRLSSDTMLPLRWTDPAAVDDLVFSEATDVWSFGVTAIEVFSRGARPYGDLSNMALLQQLKEGHLHAQPVDMPASVYTDVVLMCWAPVSGPDAGLCRASFAELVDMLNQIAAARGRRSRHDNNGRQDSKSTCRSGLADSGERVGSAKSPKTSRNLPVYIHPESTHDDVYNLEGASLDFHCEPYAMRVLDSKTIGDAHGTHCACNEVAC